MDEATSIIAIIGGIFAGLVVLIVVLARVLSRPRATRFAGSEPEAGVSEWEDTSTDSSTAFSELSRFPGDGDAGGSEGDPGGSDTSDSSSGDSDSGDSDSGDSGGSDGGGGSDD